jgi:DNA-binding response OmpR family regulator
MRVLMVEDEKYMAQAVAEILRKNHYAVDLVHDGSNGLDFALSGIHDIIILDIMLPRMSGLDILQNIRRKGIKAPVILLTAKGQVEDKVKGLDYGADDYLAKPFHTGELLARLRALHRRKPELCNDGVISFGDLEFSPHTLIVRCAVRETELKLKEAQLLELLIANRNRVLSKSIIIEKVWGFATEAEDNHVETHISRLRKRLTQVQSKTTITTVRGAGYTIAAGEGEKGSVQEAAQ